jgi:hypothetical protein
MAKFIGGPWDGREHEVTSFRVMVPWSEPVEAKWFEENESVPMEIDPISGEPRMVRPTISTHVYQRGKDGHYYYQRPSQ